jgi:hypothetical protein
MLSPDRGYKWKRPMLGRYLYRKATCLLSFAFASCDRLFMVFGAPEPQKR